MSTRSGIKISNKARQKLECFKRIVDVIVEEKLTFEDYVELVLSRGIASMIRDVIPADVEILLNSMEQIFDAYPDSTSDFIIGTLKKGEEINLRKRWFGE
jgi:hypothetical protein